MPAQRPLFRNPDSVLRKGAAEADVEVRVVGVDLQPVRGAETGLAAGKGSTPQHAIITRGRAGRTITG